MTDAEIGAWAEAVGGSEEERVSGCVEARLVYDSARDPVPAGLRSTYRPSQVLYEAEDYCLDLQLSLDQLQVETVVQRSSRALVVIAHP